MKPLRFAFLFFSLSGLSLTAGETPSSAALCYQRLQVSETDLRFTLHGLNAVHLRRHGWYRLDARGNKPGVDATFCPPTECLAFLPIVPGECDLPGRFADPLSEVVDVLTRGNTEDEVFRCLPEVPAAIWPVVSILKRGSHSERTLL